MLKKLSDDFSAKSLKFGVAIYVLFIFCLCFSLLMPTTSGITIDIAFFICLSTLLIKYYAAFCGLRSEYSCSSLYEKEYDLPIYTILLPLRNEGRVVSNLIKVISQIDYPKEKLDVKLIVDDDDLSTILAIREINIPVFMELVIVPSGFPKTKPRACNYALQFAKGDYVTIYDAEDSPDPLQLKKALAAFYGCNFRVACVQSRLNYYNANINMLTKFFALEYLFWFACVLPGFQKKDMPVPLGGTSNHFSVEILRKVGGWDDYNVTEDADLGLRLSLYGYKTLIIDSTTLEESPISVWAWIKQRSRWIKGYIITYLVHLRHIKIHYKSTSIKGVFFINCFVGFPAIVFFITPFMFLNLFLYPQTYVPFIYFILSYVLHLIGMFAAILKHKYYRNGMQFFIIAIIFPLYFFLHSVASVLAVWELIFNPYKWNKTEHGSSP